MRCRYQLTPFNCDGRNGSLASVPRGSWQRRNMTKSTTMEMIMSTTVGTPAAEGGLARSRGNDLIATVRTWWMAYLVRRIERAAIIQLHAMSDRELQDIGLTRCQIERAARDEFDHRPLDGCPAAREPR